MGVRPGRLGGGRLSPAAAPAVTVAAAVSIPITVPSPAAASFRATAALLGHPDLVLTVLQLAELDEPPR